MNAYKSHTPGPWMVEQLQSGKRLIAELTDGNKGLVNYRIVHEGIEEGNGVRDAELIASAPDLLSACKAALPWVPNLQIRHIIEKAILKAEGSK